MCLSIYMRKYTHIFINMFFHESERITFIVRYWTHTSAELRALTGFFMDRFYLYSKKSLKTKCNKEQNKMRIGL